MAQEAVNNLSFFRVPLHTKEGRSDNQPLNPKIFYEALKTSIETRLLDDKDVELAATLEVMDTKTWPTKLPITFGENEMRKLASRFKRKTVNYRFTRIYLLQRVTRKPQSCKTIN